MSTVETYGDPAVPSFHTAERRDHPESDCTNCGHASDCATHNEPALPAGRCNCRPLATGGFLHGENATLIGGADGIEHIIPRKAWDRGHEKLRLFDGAAIQSKMPTLPALQDFVTPLLRQMIDRQVEQRASLPQAPEGYEWAIVTEWPRFDVDHTNEYKVTWRWVLRAADGSDQ